VKREGAEDKVSTGWTDGTDGTERNEKGGWDGIVSRKGRGGEEGKREREMGRRTGDPIASKIAITVVGFLCITGTLLAGEFGRRTEGGAERVLTGRLRGARASGVSWEELVRVEVGEVLVPSAKCRIKGRAWVVRRAAGRSLGRRWLVRRRAGRCGGRGGGS